MIIPFANRKPIYEVFSANEDVLVAAIKLAAKESADKMGSQASRLFSKNIKQKHERDLVAA